MYMKKKRALAYPYRHRSILHIDIGSETYSQIPLEEDEAKALLGGRLLALTLWERFAQFDELDRKSYERGNPVVFAPGAGVDTPLSCCTSFTVVTKSPVTGALSITSAASSLAQAIVDCGYSALVITGRARRLSSFSISEGKVGFSSSEELHDQLTTEVAKRSNAAHVVAIGPAGEHLVSHASLYANGQNITRGGVGLVFGMKNIKYFTLHPHLQGRDSYDSERMGKLSTSLLKEMNSTKIGRTIAEQGSIALLQKANHHGWAAIDTYSTRIDGRLWGLCPRSCEQQMDAKVPACPACTERNALDLESGMALGSNLELFDSRSVQQLVTRCLENGLDPVSVGSVLAWARKCRQDGLLGFLPDMQRSSAMVYLRLIDAMAFGRGTGEQLGKSLGELVSLYGGFEHAYMVQNLPLQPYDYRALPVQATLAAIGDETLVVGELLWGNRYRRGNERRLASWALSAQTLGIAMEGVGFCHWASVSHFAHPLLHFPHFKREKRLLSQLSELASLSEGYEIDSSWMMSYARTCLKKQREITYRLRGKTGPYGELPDQLLVNGKSNFRAAQVVPLARLLDAYWSLSSKKSYWRDGKKRSSSKARTETPSPSKMA